MTDKNKTQAPCIDDLEEMRQRMAELEAADTERRQAEEALRCQRDELSARNAILSATLHTADLDELLHLIIDEVLAFLRVEFGGIHLLQADRVVLRAWRGLSADFRAQVLSFPADDPPDWMCNPYVVHEHLNDVDVTPEFAKGEGIQAWASIPLHLPPKDGGEGKWLGALTVGSRRYEALREDKVRVLKTLSDQLALAIDHLRAYREAQERLARLQTLHDIDRAIIQRLDLRGVLHVVLERVPKELGAEAAAISLLDKDQWCSKVFVMHLPNGTFVEEEAFELAESLLHWFVERQEPVLIHDLTQDPRVRMHRERIHNKRLISYLGVPLVARDQTIGILHILTMQPKVFVDEDVAFFRTLAGQAGMAIENARLYEEVRASEERYRAALDHASDAIFSIDVEDARIVDANWEATELTGYSKEELIGKPIWELHPEADVDRVKALYLDPVRMKGAGTIYEIDYQRKDGTIVPTSVSSNVIEYGGKRLVQRIVRDMTEQKALEERQRQMERELLQHSKLAAIGQLAAGVAHELNGPIGFIHSNLGTLRKYVSNIKHMMGKCEEMLQGTESAEDPLLRSFYEAVRRLKQRLKIGFIMEDLDKVIEESLDEVERIAEIVRNLRDFSRVDRAELEVADVNEGLETTLRIVWNEVKYKANVVREYGEIPPVWCYPQQLNQVFMNLLVNAAQAIEGQGTIWVRTYQEGDQVVVEVEDTGIGIPEAHRDRILEPFFTTKEGGEGMGLGLSMSYDIVQKHGGRMEIESEVGKGSTFRVILPIERST